jgi:carbon-monoxide dehydrogenase large subunit
MPGSILGNAVLRTEDPRFLRGVAEYVDDLDGDGALCACFVRANVAHARISRIDTSDALRMAGVEGVYAADDVGLQPPRMMRAIPEMFARHPLARGTVRFVGEPIAVVLAATRTQAADAAEAVAVDYDPLPSVTDPIAAALEGAPLLFPDHRSNVAMEWNFAGEADALEGADVVARGRFVNQRVIAVPMEVNGCVAEPDASTGGLRAWVPCQGAHGAQNEIARALGLERENVHVIVPAVGGAFGAKGGVYPEQLVVCKLALMLGRRVRYFETRSDNMTAMHHGRGQVQDVELGLRRDGTILGLRVRVISDCGAYPGGGAFMSFISRIMLAGVYKIPRLDFVSKVVVSNTTPTSAYRGAGRPEATALLERIMDIAALELGMDKIELRRRNFIPPQDFPHKTVTGIEYDNGDYDLPLTEALRLSGYDDVLSEQRRRRESGNGKLLGIGLSVYVEITGGAGAQEFGSVEVHADGSVTVLTGTAPHGQGHETAWAQIASSILGVPIESIRVIHSDTKLVRSGGGTGGSRSLQTGGSAVYRASEAVLEKARGLSAHLLEASPEDIVVFDDGRLGVAGVPASAISWADLASAAADPGRLPEGMEAGLLAALDFDQGGGTFPFGAHVAVVEVDADTGRVELVKHVAVDDAGTVVNPVLFEGQQHGGIAQGVAQALFEGVHYDDDGNPLTGTLASYAMPSAAELPFFQAHHTQTPTPKNPLGAKGIGEAATIGSTPAVQNAVVDALSHLGVRHLDMPLTPERVWRAIQGAAER